MGVPGNLFSSGSTEEAAVPASHESPDDGKIDPPSSVDEENAADKQTMEADIPANEVTGGYFKPCIIEDLLNQQNV